MLVATVVADRLPGGADPCAAATRYPPPGREGRPATGEAGPLSSTRILESVRRSVFGCPYRVSHDRRD
ncbi:MAG: hypothetical protein JWP83_4970 [Mycobacterium sp.]|nr:hypothetical protein [Mycobacterium sp.]